ncbi:MAG: substrate-binding domain-containing protein [Pseudomonadota bacterium]
MAAKPVAQDGFKAGRRTTIADVSSALGLTKGTVSRALNGYPDISDATRLRVERAAERLGYRPLSHAQAIRTGRVRSLGLVLQIDEHDAHAPFLTDFLAGVSEAASAENWTLAVATANSDSDMRRTLQRMTEDHKADGYILPRTRMEDPRVAYLRGAGVPFILYGRTDDPEGCAWYDTSGEVSMRAAVARLFGLGHRRIGFVGGGREYTYTVLRHQGYLRGMADMGLTSEPGLQRFDARRTSEASEATEALMCQDLPPTAIIFATDEAAMGAYPVADRLGLTIGADLSIIGYDGIPEGEFAQPPLTTCVVDARRAGTRLAELFIQLVRGTKPEDLREEETARFVSRGTDRAPTRSPAELGRLIASKSAVRSTERVN